jgi:Fe2+ or Zn2+ uptake regulation protein
MPDVWGEELNTFTCAKCGEFFESAWTQEEAMTEKNRDWAGVPFTECVIVCDGCYRVVMRVMN